MLSNDGMSSSDDLWCVDARQPAFLSAWRRRSWDFQRSLCSSDSSGASHSLQARPWSAMSRGRVRRKPDSLWGQINFSGWTLRIKDQESTTHHDNANFVLQHGRVWSARWIWGFRGAEERLVVVQVPSLSWGSPNSRAGSYGFAEKPQFRGRSPRKKLKVQYICCSTHLKNEEKNLHGLVRIYHLTSSHH